MNKIDRNVRAIYDDTAELVEALIGKVTRADDGDAYWLDEAANHMRNLYEDACLMQDTIQRLRAQLATGRK